jgi:hypothetical protein
MKAGLSATKERLTLLLYLFGHFWCVNSASGRNVNFLDRVAEVKKVTFAVVVELHRPTLKARTPWYIDGV